MRRGSKHTEESIEKMRLHSKPPIGGTVSMETRKKMGLSRTLEKNPQWKGGRLKRNGYIWIRSPGHPYADAHGYVFEHRLVAEKAIGHFLHPKHPVHHINHIKDDNRKKNLVVCEDNAYHRLLHLRERRMNHE